MYREREILTNVRVLDSLLQLTGTDMAGDSGLSVDMAEVDGDTGGVDDIVERQVCDKVGLLQEKREGLTDTSSGACDGDLDHVCFVGG